MQKVSRPVDVELNRMYRQIGIRSHGKGLFHKDEVSGVSLGNKRVFWVDENLFVLNIVFAWEQAVAKTSYLEKGMVASHRFPMYKPKKNISITDYILYFFLTKKGKHYLGLASPGGAGRNKTLGQKNFEELDVIVPEVDEQTKIANFLTAVDEKIAQLTQKADLLARYKKGVMQQIFSQQLRFKDDDGREFPEWEEKSLGDVAVSISNGLSLVQNSNSEGYKVTRIETISDKSINLNKVGYVLTDEDISSSKLEIGNILFSNINSISHIGKVVYVDADYDLYHGMNLLRIEVNLPLHNSKFIFYQLSSEKLKQTFETKANKAVNQASINQTELKKTALKIPSKPEQTKIANFLTALDDKINLNQTRLNALKQYKQGLLQQMFV
jgi:type I restriction enzyme S subunit